MSLDSFGVELYTEDGRLFYSTEMATYNYIQQFQVKAGTEATVSFKILVDNPEFQDKLVQRSFVNPPPLDKEPIVPSYNWVGNTLHISNDGNVDTLITVLAR